MKSAKKSSTKPLTKVKPADPTEKLGVKPGKKGAAPQGIVKG